MFWYSGQKDKTARGVGLLEEHPLLEEREEKGLLRGEDGGESRPGSRVFNLHLTTRELSLKVD